jgi:hypothetical protein
VLQLTGIYFRKAAGAEYRQAAPAWVRLVAAMLQAGQYGVCTKYTLGASDPVVLVPDRAGLRTFPELPRVCGGGNAVRVPPWARVFPVQGLVGL